MQVKLFETPYHTNGFRDSAFTRNKELPLHRWVPWIAGFSAQFVADCLDKYLSPGSRSNAWVLDPFAGVGTIAAYGQAGDDIRFYEINPAVTRLAISRYFSCLKDCPAHLEILPGDARISLERELEHHEPQQFDLLALDAFSGDAIPVHLLTEEAFEAYLKHLRKPDGVLAVYISNLYLDLRPVARKAAEHFGLRAAWIHASKEGQIARASDWVLLAENGALLDLPEIAGASSPWKDVATPVPLWTDDYSNLFQVLRREVTRPALVSVGLLVAPRLSGYNPARIGRSTQEAT